MLQVQFVLATDTDCATIYHFAGDGVVHALCVSSRNANVASHT